MEKTANNHKKNKLKKKYKTTFFMNINDRYDFLKKKTKKEKYHKMTLL